MTCDKKGPTKWEVILLPSNRQSLLQNPEQRTYIIILDSSMVEHSAVNRVVAGSSPARGARAKEESGAAVPKLKRIRLRGQAVKTSPCHGGGRRFESDLGRLYGNIQVVGILAQLGEHLPYKQRVIGSSPIGPTKPAWRNWQTRRT